MAPNITEILFELGLGEKVVGVTRFCNYPPEAETRPRIGGFLDPNYEAIVALEPDLVILLSSQGDEAKKLCKLGIETLAVKHETIDDIKVAIGAIGARCGAEEKAVAKIKEIELGLVEVKKKVAGLSRPRVLVSLGRDLSTGKINSVTLAGRNNFYDEIVKLAGGENVVKDKKYAYPEVSAEGLLSLNPDVIIDLVTDLVKKGLSVDDVKNNWNFLPGINAVKGGRVYVITDNYVMKPGPRILKIVYKFAMCLHPEVDWKK